MPAGLLTIAFLFFFYTGLAQSPYPGKIKITLTFNGVPVPGFEGDFEDVFIYDNRYYFERLITRSSQSEYELQPPGKNVATQSKLTKSTVSENITGYLLTDVLDSICIEFDTSRSVPKVIKTYPLREKNKGIRLCPEQIIFLDIATDLLKHTGDTLVQGKAYQLLTENTTRSKDAEGRLLIKNTAWLDTALQGFPFHISKRLDERFNGFICRIDQLYQGGNVISIIYEFKGGLSLAEIELIRKFITGAVKKL